MLFEDGLGPHGYPMFLALDPDNDGWFEIDSDTVDYAKKAWDDFEEENKKHKFESGTVHRLIFTKPKE